VWYFKRFGYFEKEALVALPSNFSGDKLEAEPVPLGVSAIVA
jgi:hypothetical protein